MGNPSRYGHLFEFSREVDYEIVHDASVLLQRCGEEGSAQVHLLGDLLRDTGTRSITEQSLVDGSESLSRESMENAVQFVNRQVRWTPEQLFRHGRWDRLDES